MRKLQHSKMLPLDLPKAEEDNDVVMENATQAIEEQGLRRLGSVDSESAEHGRQRDEDALDVSLDLTIS